MDKEHLSATDGPKQYWKLLLKLTIPKDVIPIQNTWLAKYQLVPDLL